MKKSVILNKLIIARTLRVPISVQDAGDSSPLARQLDITLLKVGFKASGELMEYVSKLHPATAHDITSNIIETVKELVGDNVEHNTYFKEFPKNVPDTLEFWAQCIGDALLNPETARQVSSTIYAGYVNLLDLPKYGKYQHTYEEMLEAHEKFIPSIKNRKIIIHLGKTLAEEAAELYNSLAASTVPLNPSDREALKILAEVCLNDTQPENIPMRENKAIVNSVRLNNNKKLLVDTPMDILRLAVALSNGDVTLEKPTKFISLPHSKRKDLLKALDAIIKKSPAKLSDIAQYSERWKRLSEKLHPYTYSHRYKNAIEVFSVARGDNKISSLLVRFEDALGKGHINAAIDILTNAPGLFIRNVDRLLTVISDNNIGLLKTALDNTKHQVSGRVLLSLAEHLNNRMLPSDNKARIFANRKGTAYTVKEERKALNKKTVAPIVGSLLLEIVDRLSWNNILVDKTVLNLALPLSNKQTADGFKIMPRGSTMPVANERLRFFCYWKQKKQRTDYDLSVILLNNQFNIIGQVSYTNLKNGDIVHSGDLTEAPKGASEFIDINLPSLHKDCTYIVPEVNIYSGERFAEAEESYFGFMEHDEEQKSKPFEPATVQMKSDMRGNGRVALPLVFMRQNNAWVAKWINLYSNGRPNFNRVESNHITTGLLAQTMVERRFMTIGKLIELLQLRGAKITYYTPNPSLEDTSSEIVAADVFIGLERPENLPKGIHCITLNNLHELIPE